MTAVWGLALALDRGVLKVLLRTPCRVPAHRRGVDPNKNLRKNVVTIDVTLKNASQKLYFNATPAFRSRVVVFY